MTKDELKTTINEAFSATEYPGDWCLVGSKEGSEPALLANEFKGKSDWRQLDAAFLDQSPDGFGTALHFFSDEALRFYLPAYLIADLDEKLDRADVLFTLCHGLNDAGKREKVNPRRYGERTWFETASYRLATFNKPQAQAIVNFLKYKLEKNQLVDSEKAEIEQALHNFWEARAV